MNTNTTVKETRFRFRTSNMTVMLTLVWDGRQLTEIQLYNTLRRLAKKRFRTDTTINGIEIQKTTETSTGNTICRLHLFREQVLRETDGIGKWFISLRL
jgi:hypothetical protein